MFAGRDPVPLGGGVDLEDVSPGAEDGLLPGGREPAGFETLSDAFRTAKSGR